VNRPAVPDFVARDPVLAPVAARRRALLDDAADHRRAARTDDAAHHVRHRWPWFLLLRALARRPCPEARP
jgi:hypothetical protein